MKDQDIAGIIACTLTLAGAASLCWWARAIGPKTLMVVGGLCCVAIGLTLLKIAANR